VTVKLNTFEGGSDETAITSGNSGGVSGDALDSDILGAVFTAHVAWSTTGSTWYGRVAFYMTAAPPANMQLIRVISSTTDRFFFRIMTGRTVQITSSAFGDLGTSTTVLALNQWNAIEFTLTAGGPAANLAQCKIYTNADFASPVETLNATSTTISSFDRIRFGCNFSAVQTYDLWIDDLGLSDAGYLGGLGLLRAPRPVRAPSAAVVRAGRW
jgi:hypothetical protein